jgi:hypothetical protein
MAGIQLQGSELVAILTIGVVLLLVGLIGKVKAQILEVGTDNKLVRFIVGILGLMLMIFSIILMIDPSLFPQLLETTPVVTTQPVPTTITQVTQTSPSLVPSETPNLQPYIFGFETCATQCSGQNSTSTFPEKTTIIYLTMQYQNIPLNANVTRTESLGNAVWVEYDCSWPYASSGVLNYTFTDPAGIASGIWTFAITVNGNVILQKSFTVLGTWANWDPIGSFNTCTGAKK